ncbi:hypothetical protein CCH79_00002481 [Gambusia affinis]|uniref:Uncharacterized protein n=1 Tax=Gambusia affinis TaxID=33528 RepID=A0A315VIM9_GAMAF|nr:hypothetical protein CCH79_00002481 [Gambusia affinis]
MMLPPPCFSISPIMAPVPFILLPLWLCRKLTSSLNVSFCHFESMLPFWSRRLQADRAEILTSLPAAVDRNSEARGSGVETPPRGASCQRSTVSEDFSFHEFVKLPVVSKVGPGGPTSCMVQFLPGSNDGSSQNNSDLLRRNRNMQRAEPPGPTLDSSGTDHRSILTCSTSRICLMETTPESQLEATGGGSGDGQTEEGDAQPPRSQQHGCYDLDDLDVTWLQLVNQEFRQMGEPPLNYSSNHGCWCSAPTGQEGNSCWRFGELKWNLREATLPELDELTMELVLVELERLCQEQMQQAIETEEGLGIEYDEDVVCDVCRSPEGEDGNEMVFCDKCNVCVHQVRLHRNVLKFDRLNSIGLWDTKHVHRSKIRNFSRVASAALGPPWSRPWAPRGAAPGQKAAVLRCGTWMQVPVCSRHRLQDRAQRLAGMWDTLVMGSIFSGQPMLTCRKTQTAKAESCGLTSGIHKAQLTWTHLVPLRVGFRAPPLLGQSRHLGWTPRAQVRHSQLP